MVEGRGKRDGRDSIVKEQKGVEKGVWDHSGPHTQHVQVGNSLEHKRLFAEGSHLLGGWSAAVPFTGGGEDSWAEVQIAWE